MQNKKILIFGGNGFIGKNLGLYLENLGHNVTSFDLQLPENQNENISYIKGSFFDEQTVQESVIDQDIIFHCISTLNPANSVEKYVSGFENDFMATIKMMRSIEKSKTKVIFLSSGGSVYGDPEIIPTTESAPLAPRQYYACLKVCIEEFLLTTNRLFSKNHKIARISNPYGPGQDALSGVGFINIAIQKSLAGETIEIWGDGDNLRDYIYIDNVCEMLLALAYDESENSIYNISSGKGESQNSLIKILKNLGLNPTVKYFPSRSIDVKNIILDNKRILKLCNPHLFSIEEGMSILIDKSSNL